MRFLFAVLMVQILSLSMELIPAGKAGLIDVLTGMGGAFGSFVRGFITQSLSFLRVFAVASIIFLVAFVFFKLFA